MTERWSEAMRALLRPGGLQDQAEAALRRRLDAEPHDTDALWKLAETHRRQGNFAAARSLYQRLRGRGPESHKAAWLHATLSGNGPPEPVPRGMWPAPFVWMTNFLTPGECDRLLALAIEDREHFNPSDAGVSPRGGDGEQSSGDPLARITLQADYRCSQSFMPRFLPKIRSLAPDILARLRMECLSRCGIEAYVRGYLTGGFFAAHYDDQLDRHRRRKLNFVYFFHRQPRRFSGGDLLLYDTDVDAEAFSQENFSRIVPLRNSIIFFPSRCWHSVTPVQCETDDFGDGRWVVNGHVERRDAG